LVRISELKMRDVVNVVDGRRLGGIKDIDIDLELGKVKALILPGQGRLFGILSRNEDVIIPWDKIIKIGVDVILVELHSFTDPKHKDEK
jgi:YlmC/YmxH family sporulation protein